MQTITDGTVIDNLRKLMGETLAPPSAISPGDGFSDILLCTDFSPASLRALREAARINELSQGRLTVMNVCECDESPEPEAIEGLVEKLRAKQTCGLQQAMKELAKRRTNAEIVCVNGDPATEIVKRLSEGSYNLAVLGTHATSGIERLVFGSTAEEVFRMARCPVMTVGPRVPEYSDSGSPIVFATDFHEPAIDALTCAARLARLTNVPLHAVHVLFASVEHDGSSAVPTIMAEALNTLKCKCAPNMKVTCEILYDTDVSRAVLHYARSVHASGIVLGVQRKRRLSAHLPPHRTYRIIAGAPCPVLTISCS